MALNASITFVPAQEDLDGKGWAVTTWTDISQTGGDVSIVPPTPVYYATLTLALAAIDASFTADTEIDAYFQSKAEANYLAANAAAVETQHTAERVAESLAAPIILGSGPGYLVPSVGTASTPDSADLTIGADITFMAKVMRNEITANVTQLIIDKAVTANQQSFTFATFGSGLWVQGMPLGTAASTVSVNLAYSNFVGIAAGVPFVVGAKISNVLGTGNLSVQFIQSMDDGKTWVNRGSALTTLATNALSFDGSSVVTVGRSWDGRIYWAEVRNGTNPLAGTTKVKFDAFDHGSGTTWTDPRGRVWTLTNGSAIVHDGRLT